MKLDELKVALAKQILGSENEDLLRSVDLLMNHGVKFTLSDDDLKALDAQHARLMRGEERRLSSSAMVKEARKAMRG